MEVLPNEIIVFELLMRLNPMDMREFCLTNKNAKVICDANEEMLSKYQLDKYKVNYTSPTDYIYSGVEYDENRSLKDILSLYLINWDETMIFVNNDITSIPVYPNLEYLDCSNTQITTLPEYPNLDHLDCNDTQITTLPEFPNLTELNCNNTPISTLPMYPKLKVLSCLFTLLTTLPAYPNLEILLCGSMITSLQMYKFLTKLVCLGTFLTTLPEFPNLTELHCNNNELQTLPMYPKLTILDCEDNLELLMIPEYPKLKSITCDEILVEFVKNNNFPKLKKINGENYNLRRSPRFLGGKRTRQNGNDKYSKS
jgi:Leucine-rich repeat (LRR) protein